MIWIVNTERKKISLQFLLVAFYKSPKGLAGHRNARIHAVGREESAHLRTLISPFKDKVHGFYELGKLSTFWGNGGGEKNKTAFSLEFTVFLKIQCSLASSLWEIITFNCLGKLFSWNQNVNAIGNFSTWNRVKYINFSPH